MATPKKKTPNDDAHFAWRLGTVLSACNDNMILEGPPGTGKSSYAQSLAQPGQPTFRITCHNDLLPSELLGHYIGEKGGATPWQPGPATRAWLEGGLLILDEITELSPESKTACHQILDDRMMAQMVLPGGERIMPHPNFRCIATTNRSALELPEALLDRFPIRMTLAVPGEAALNTLPEDLREVAYKTYTSCAWTPEHPRRPFITFRELRTFAALRIPAGPVDAAKLVWQTRGSDVLAHIAMHSAQPDTTK